MSKKRKWTKPLAGIGCLSVIVIVVVLVVAVGIPKLKSMVNGDSDQSQWDLMGPTIDQPVTVGSVSNGIQTYGVVKPIRETSLSFGYGNATVSMINAFPGMPVMAGDVLVQVDTEERERDLAQAKAHLQDAQDELDALLSGVDLAAKQLELKVELAQWQEKLTDAQTALADFDAGKGTPAEERERAAQELAQAQANLNELVNSQDRQETIDQLQWVYNQSEVKHGEMTVIPNPSEQDMDIEWLLRIDMLEKSEALEQAKLQYQTDIANAEWNVQTAQQKLDRLDAEIALGSQDIARQEIVAQIAAAQTRIAQITAALTNLSENVETAEVAEARAKVIKMEGAMEEAENAMEDSVLIAPFDGVVAELNVQEGSLVSAGTPVAIIQDTSSLRIIAQMSEVDLKRISEGDAVVVTFDAYPDQQVYGTVGELPLTGTYENGITTYEVPVFLEDVGVDLMTGMSANVLIPLETIDNVLVVPSAAVFSEYTGDYYVWLVDGNDVKKQYVEVGISDGLNTEIKAGLDEGQVVRMVTQSYSQSSGGMVIY